MAQAVQATDATIDAHLAGLATEMGVTVADVSGFILCIGIWMEKGLSFEAAIERHQAQMLKLAENAVQLAKNLRPAALDWFCPAVA
ncbi:MAG: hypothetical protein JWO51_113 [Rhodospirillales bacterium]|nr:hypothetical protein [Rhodospirillales bacterium]